MKVLDALKANKEPVLMILGTVGVVADVFLAVRNGVRMKHKLEDLEDSRDEVTHVDMVVACAPELAEIFGLTAVSLGCFWFARKINIDRIISIGSVAAMYQQRCENQEKVFKSELDDDVYVELEEKVNAENAKSAAKNVSKRKDRIVKHGGDTLYLNDATGFAHKWDLINLGNCFNKWKKDMTSTICNWSPRDDEWVPVTTLYEDYWGEGHIAMNDDLGWTWSDIHDLRLETSNPPIEIDSFDEPVIPIRLSIRPRVMPSKVNT